MRFFKPPRSFAALAPTAPVAAAGTATAGLLPAADRLQCDNNHNLALEKLLELQSEEPAGVGRPEAPPKALHTRQVGLQ